MHVKTAGTTWLEEVIGLAESGGEGLELVKEIYAQARDHFAELAAPYSTAIDIDPDKLPNPKSVMGWSSAQYADTLGHVESSPQYNPDFRQLLYVGFKVAAGMGKRFTGALEANEEIVGGFMIARMCLGISEAGNFPSELLESQFAALERPGDAIMVDARLPFQDLVEQIINALKASPSR